MPAERVRRVLVDPGNFQRGGICDGSVAIGAREINRIVRRDFVELRARRKLRRFPESLDPATPGDPFVRLGLRGALFYFGEKIFK